MAPLMAFEGPGKPFYQKKLAKSPKLRLKTPPFKPPNSKKKRKQRLLLRESIAIVLSPTPQDMAARETFTRRPTGGRPKG